MSRVLVTGATGYVASRLIPELIRDGHDLRVTSRDPRVVADEHPEVQAVASDVFDEDSLRMALSGIEVAYYLVHSMASGDFEEADRRAAENFLSAAESEGVRRIVYLGGLGREDDELSTHLRSRQEVGEVLRSGTTQVLELRAAIVIGNGSAAFEMLRELTERLPVMIAPRWLSTPIQPIAESDLVAYLVACASVEIDGDRVIEVGGRDVLDYRQMILGYARSRGMRRFILSVPVLTPSLSSHWVNLVTSADRSVAVPLIEGLRNEVVVTDPSGMELFPSIDPGDYATAVRQALKDQMQSVGRRPPDEVPRPRGGILIDSQSVPSTATKAALATHIHSVGGRGSWYPMRWAWWIRAKLDDLFGGAGLQWQRPEDDLATGDKVDWWKVAGIGPARLLLEAEMRTPGEAWLEWRAVDAPQGSELQQTAYFRPRGWLGRLYWWGLYPIHVPIFRALAKRIARTAS